MDFDKYLGKNFTKTYFKMSNKHNLRGAGGRFIKKSMSRYGVTDDEITQEKATEHQYTEIAEFVYQKFDEYSTLVESKWRKIGVISKTDKVIRGYDLNDNNKIKNFLVVKILGGVEKITFTPITWNTSPKIDSLYVLGYKGGVSDAENYLPKYIPSHASQSYQWGYNDGYDVQFKTMNITKKSSKRK